MSKLIRLSVLPTIYYSCSVWCNVVNKEESVPLLSQLTRQIALMVCGGLHTLPYKCIFSQRIPLTETRVPETYPQHWDTSVNMVEAI